MKKYVPTLIFIVLLGIFFQLGRISGERKVAVTENSNQKITSTTFTCAENKRLQAVFFDDKVELTLSDKRSFLLFTAMSASGVRYTNSDESFIFWNKGNTAFIEEHSKITYKECVESNN